MDDVVMLVGVVSPGSGDRIRYVKDTVEGLTTIDATLSHRDWDVTDKTAQRLAAERELGDLTAYPKCGFQWWINPTRNSAVLAVYRTPDAFLRPDFVAHPAKTRPERKA